MKSARLFTLRLLVLDALTVWAAFNAVGWMRGVAGPGLWLFTPLFVPLAVIALGFYLIDGYRARTDMLSLDYASEHLIALLLALLTVTLLTFVVIPAGFPLQQSRPVVALSFLILTPVTLTYRRWGYLLRLRQREERTIVFLGDRASAGDFAAECGKLEFNQPVLYANPDPATSATPDDPRIPFTGILEQIERGQLAVEALVLRESRQEFPADVSQRLMRLYFRGVPTYTLELFHQVYWRKIPLYRLNQAWLFQEGFKVAREPVYERFKRLSDILLAGAGLILASPVLLLAALAIVFEDRGPVFFRQPRIGRNRRTFAIIKLRTMRVQAAGSRYTQTGDARITRVGRFLRASRLDEFPQLWNVLRGDMSLIGPRAEWDALVDDYEKQIPCYHFRHLVKPGITGWAQVNYPYGASIEDTLRKLEYDLYYIRHFSILLDAAIVLKTLHVILFGKGR